MGGRTLITSGLLGMKYAAWLRSALPDYTYLLKEGEWIFGQSPSNVIKLLTTSEF